MNVCVLLYCHCRFWERSHPMVFTLSNLRLSHGSTCRILKRQIYMMMSSRYVCKFRYCSVSCIVKEVGDIAILAKLCMGLPITATIATANG